MVFQVLTWGSGSCVGCGTADMMTLVPHKVDDLSGNHVLDIAAGDSHCLALTDDCQVSQIFWVEMSSMHFGKD